MKKMMYLSVLALAVVCMGTVPAMAAANLPYANALDSAPSGDLTASGGSVITGGGANGGNHLSLAGTLALDVTAGTYSNVWIQVWAKPQPGATEPTVSPNTISGAFYINSSGDLKAWSNNVWVTVATGLPTDAATWVGFVVHADYDSFKYDIYRNTGAYGAPLEKLNASPIQFDASPATKLQSVSVESGNTAYVDALAVAKGSATIPVSASSPNRVQPHEFAAGTGVAQSFDLPVYSDLYTPITNTSPNSTIGGTLGNELLSGLTAGDIVQVYAAPSEYSYDVQNAANTYWGGASQNIPVPFVAALTLTRLNGAAATVGFFSYNNAMAYAYDGVHPPSAPSYPAQTTLYGKGGGQTGFTALNLPTEQNANSYTALKNTANFQNGDILFKQHDPTTATTWDELRWSESDGMWKYFGQTSGSRVNVFGGANAYLYRTMGDVTVSVTF